MVFLDRFVTAYLNNILIYSDTLEKHWKHVRSVLEALSKVGLQLNPEKSEFPKEEEKYKRLIIPTGGVKMDPDKVATVKDWPVL